MSVRSAEPGSANARGLPPSWRRRPLREALCGWSAVRFANHSGSLSAGIDSGRVPLDPTTHQAVAACYFDVDGTLVSSNLVHPTLYYLMNQGTPLQSVLKLGRALIDSPRLMIAEMVDRRTFNEMLFSSYAGTSEDRMMLLAQEAFDNVMRPSLYPGARSLVEKSRAAGHDVVLVSGALECVLERLAEYFGGAEVIGNRLEMKDGIATGKLLKPVVAGPEKARLIREHAAARGYDLGDCFAFSDSYSDVPMLSVVGHPAAVNPDKRLSWLAKAYGWPSFDLSRAA